MRHKVTILGTVTGMLALFSPNASASMQLTLNANGVTVTVNDNQSGDLNPAPGVITFLGPVGKWNQSISTGFVGTNPVLDLNSFNQFTCGGSCNGNNTLTLTLSGTGFTQAFLNQLNANIGGTIGAGHTLTYLAYVDANDVLDAKTTLIGSGQTFASGNSGNLSFSGTTSGLGAKPDQLFSLTMVITINPGKRNGITSFDANVDVVDVVPEPATVSMLGTVLFLSAGALRRRFSRKQTAESGSGV